MICKLGTADPGTAKSFQPFTAIAAEAWNTKRNHDKKSWRGETVKLRILLHVRFGGGSFKNDLES